MESLQTVLAQWPQWPVSEQPTVVKEFTAGLNHKSVLLKSGADLLVLKIFQQPAVHTLSAQQWAHKLGLAPEILFSERQGKYLLMQYLRAGKPDVAPLAKALRRLHIQPTTNPSITNGAFDYSLYLSEYLDTASNEIANALLPLQPAIDYYLQDPTPLVICHNDLVVENCFVNSEVAKFIDWDFAQVNNPWFDLASVIHYHQLDSELAHSFLDCYETGWGDKTGQPIFFSAQCAVLVLDIAWHEYKFGSQHDDGLGQKLTKLISLKNDFELALH